MMTSLQSEEGASDSTDSMILNDLLAGQSSLTGRRNL